MKETDRGEYWTMRHSQRQHSSHTGLVTVVVSVDTQFSVISLHCKGRVSAARARGEEGLLCNPLNCKDYYDKHMPGKNGGRYIV